MQSASDTNQRTKQISELLAKYDKAISRGQAFRRAAANNQTTQEEILADLETLFTVEILNEQDQNPKKQRTALHQAVINQVKPAIKFLLNKGASYTLNDFEQHTAIYYASQSKDQEIKQLFLAQLEKDNPTYNGKSLLHLAVEQQDINKVALLLNLGADYNKKDDNGETPICYLAKIKDEKIKKLLLTKLTNDILPKVYAKYKNLSDEQRNKELDRYRQIKSLMKTKDENINNLIQFILLAILQNSPANCNSVDVTRATEKAKEFMSLVNLTKTFVSYDNWKSIVDIYKKMNNDEQLPNFCGLLCHELTFALLMHPAFLLSKISLSSLYIDNLFSGGDHEVIVINGNHIVNNESTILCNPFRYKSHIGPHEIKQYLDLAPTGSVIDYCPHNIPPMYQFFKSDQQIFETFLSQVKQVFLTTTTKPANEPVVIQFLLEKARTILKDQPETAKRVFACTRGKFSNLLENCINKMLNDNNSLANSLGAKNDKISSSDDLDKTESPSSPNVLCRKK